ncbi:hypothetical protein OG689_16825 [Kitasatospora sp. NBC_00240]|uniref:hypothetical protein n=1 Tax=Kitasatospora sp. NBC_00240 TaxID=2903567 RepID=UPI00225087CB|nr:hypothetical protein [Kitasatospora sp. NBC_00240]MCX5210936.1 hypothetical protein [Kitasatospora sp. NBC_00240]
MLVEPVAFVLIGLLVGAFALAWHPEYFPPSRALTLGTAVVAALVSGVIAHYALGGALSALVLAISATGSALLVSVLARPEPAGRRAGAHRDGAGRHAGRRRPA